MAIVAPMAEYRQLPGKSTSPLTHDIICLHTMVGTLEGSISWSARAGGSYWHFGLGGNGRLVQCQDLRYRSAANLYGNWRVIPIETADTKEGIFPAWSGSNVPGWTPAQIDKLVALIAWLCQQFNIPPVLIPDTRPGRRGIAFHRQGCDPWRVSGGELWSKAYGKVCPGDRRIDQLINVVIPRVRAVLGGGSLPPTSSPEEWDEMATKQEVTDAAVEAINIASRTPGSALRTTLADTAKAFAGVPVVVVAEGAPNNWWAVTLSTKTLITSTSQKPALDLGLVRYAPGAKGPVAVSQEFLSTLETV